MTAKPQFVEIEGALYSRVTRDERPPTVHFLPNWRRNLIKEDDRYMSSCGRYLLRAGQAGTSVRSEVTCLTCCRVLGTSPASYPRARLVSREG